MPQIVTLHQDESEIIVADTKGNPMFKLKFDNTDAGCELMVDIWYPKLLSPDKWVGNFGDEPFIYEPT
jgi:hypothetical protein